MTNWAEVVSAALVLIDDIRLHEQLQVSPAQFYRRMAGLIQQAMTLLSRPPKLLYYIKSEMVEPVWGDYEWTSTEESMESQTVVGTGQVGFDLCSCVMLTRMDNGSVSYTPYSVSYDAETGDVTFPQQTTAGVTYMLDFYTDGEFATLTDTQKRIFALAVAVIWDERFSRNWLNIQMKIKDESFETVNEANYIEKTTKRLHDNRIAFNDELRWYEQNAYYSTALKNTDTYLTLV